MGDIILQTRGLTKIFGSLTANNEIDLDIETGTIHAIAGENGAGKSTLMKILYGVYQASSGTILVDGEIMENWNAAAAREKGISMVFQDFRLIPAFTVLENVFLSQTKSGVFINRRELRKKIQELSVEYHLHLDPDEEVWRMDLGQRQHIEIIKILINPNTRIMIFDEPTSVLAPNEVESFLKMLTHFKNNKYAIILITHKINEILAVADKVTILRGGKNMGTMSKEEGFNRGMIINRMLGENADKLDEKFEAGAGLDFSSIPSVALKNFAVKDDHNRTILRNVNFELPPAEIIGLAGISGNGQKELAEAIFGIRRISSGSLFRGEKDLTKASPQNRIRCGFRMVTEDPVRDTVVPTFTVLENMALVGLAVKTIRGNIDWKKMQEQLDSHTEINSLNVPASRRLAGTLSGGNIQRLSFARAVIARPSLLIACYPSRGLDVATVHAVHNTLYRLRNTGTAILLISEDLSELFDVADKIVVLAAHTSFGPYNPKEYDMNHIGEIMLKGDMGDEKRNSA
jgi:simple sugar transport system ATP-binding protein